MGRNYGSGRRGDVEELELKFLIARCFMQQQIDGGTAMWGTDLAMQLSSKANFCSVRTVDHCTPN